MSYTCMPTWLFHKVIFIYADLNHQGPKCDHQDPLCDHSSYADLNHPDSFIFVRLNAHPYTYLCPKLKFIYADLNHQLSILTPLVIIHHPLYANLAHPYIYHFLKVICIYADLDHQGPLCDNSSMLTWITHTPIVVLR